MFMAREPLRVLFLLRNKLENIQVVPLGSSQLHASAAHGGTLAGRAELLTRPVAGGHRLHSRSASRGRAAG